MRPSTKDRLLLAVAAPLCAVIVAGCANWQIPAVDPSGQRLLAPRQATLSTEPGAVLPRHDAGIVLTPVHVIAPVNSEVILLAGICGRDGHLQADKRVSFS